jgi:hypothetical protein
VDGSIAVAAGWGTGVLVGAALLAGVACAWRAASRLRAKALAKVFASSALGVDMGLRTSPF